MYTPTILQGNTFTLAIPLRVYIIGEGGVVLEDYTPDECDEVVITLKGPRRFYTYTPRIDGNVARIDLGGYELCGLYSVAVAITKDDGQKLRTYRGAQLSIVESIDAVTDSELEQGIEQGVLYLDAATFLSGADGRGIESVVKTATDGLVDTYTITYTDGTTSTFDVTNGRDGEDGQPGAPGTPGEDGVGIVSIAKTGTVGLVDIYTIALTNGATYTFEVTNGKDGTTPDMSNYYDKGESDNLLGGKISKGSLKTINNESLEGSGNLSLATQEELANKADITTLVDVSSTGDVIQALDSGKFYRFGEVDSLTLTLTAPQAGMGIYGGKFTASASWTALGIPASVDEAAGNDSIEGGKTYEFNMVDNVIVIKEV
jgi:hypothetical protein